MSEEKEARQSIKDKLNEKLGPMFDKVGTLSRKQRLLICLVTLALLGGGYYYFFLTPKLQKKNELTQKKEELNNQLITYKRGAAQLKKVEAQFKAVEDEFQMALMALPDKKEIPSLLTAVSNSGNAAGLEFLLFKPEGIISGDFYAEIPVSIKVSGGYHQIAEFFDRVSQLSRLVNIDNISMNYASKNGELLVSCRAVTYMYLEKKEETKEQTKKDKRKRGRRRS